MKKPILVLTSAFPPSGGSGVQRIVKFVKYMDGFEWCCHVITSGIRERVDESMVDDIPESTEIYRKCKRVETNYTGYTKERKPSFSKKVINKLNTWLLVPEDDIISALSLLPLGKKIIAKYKIKIIFATVPSFSIAVAAVCLKNITGAKLVLDFRDPWSESNLYNWSFFKRKIQRIIEFCVVKASDVIITNTKELETVFRKKYAGLNITTINNGYDTTDFPEIFRKNNLNLPLKIVHTGEFYSGIRSPQSLLVAVGELYNEGKVDNSTLEINFIGGGELIEEDEFLDNMNRYKLSDIIRIHNYLPHKKAIQEMVESDVLLLMQNSPKASLQIPAKAFEYLYLKKPILSLSPDGATSNLIRETDSGIVVDPENIELIKEKIIEMISFKKKGVLNNSFSYLDIEQYDRKYLTSKLSDIIDSILE